MAKLFIGLALALMLATAALGFLAKGNIDKLQSTVKGANSQIQAEQGKARTAANEKAEAVKERDAATAKADDATKALDAKTAEVTAAKQQADEAKALVDAKTKEVAELTAKVANMPTTPVKTEEDPRVAQMTAELQKSQAELAEAKQVLQATIDRSKGDADKVAALEQEKKRREKGIQVPGLQGRILAVNSGWNFVVLSVGDKQGVTVNSSLLVVRGGEPIARLRTTSVEPSTSIADVLPGTVRRGLTVQPGDTIIFEGTRNVAPKTEGGPSAVPAPALPN